MVHVGIRTLKTHLSEYLRRVKEGETVLVEERRHPIAVLSPIGTSEHEFALLGLVREGVATWGGGKPRGHPRPPRLRGRRASDLILEERR